MLWEPLLRRKEPILVGRDLYRVKFVSPVPQSKGAAEMVASVACSSSYVKYQYLLSLMPELSAGYTSLTYRKACILFHDRLQLSNQSHTLRVYSASLYHAYSGPSNVVSCSGGAQ